MTLTVIVPFVLQDRDQALRLIRWIQELGPQPARFFLMTRKGLQDPAILPEGWEWLTDWEMVDTKWSQGHTDASGPNSLWRQTAREARRLKLGPWLWLEPDALPLRRDWVQALTDDYIAGKKPFMGGKAPKGNRLSGVAVYHQDTPAIVQRPFLCGGVAFDAAAGDDFMKLGHVTPLICDQFRCPPFLSLEDFDARVPMGAAIHHGDKTGSVYEFARVRINGGPSAPFFSAKRDSSGEFEPEQFRSSPKEPVVFERVPDRPDAITDMLNRKANGTPAILTVVQHLDAIMELVGTSKPRRMQLYTELQKRGIECGRKTKKRKLAEAK